MIIATTDDRTVGVPAEVPERSLTPHIATTADDRLARILRANLALEILVVVSVTAVYVVAVRSPWVLLIIGVVSLYAVAVWWAMRCNQRGRVTAAIVWASIGYVPVGIVNALVAPFSLPLVVLAALLPALLAVPYLDRRGMSAMVSACFAVTVLITTIATISTVSDVQDEVPDAMRSVILVLGIPAIAALLVLIQWEGHLTMAARSDALRRSERRLAEASDVERARLERRLQGSVTGPLRRGEDHVQAAIGADLDTADASLVAASEELTAAADQLRRLAQGMYPAVLDSHGVGRAIASLVERRGLAATLAADDRRFDPDVERAVYFSCAEAIDNVATHAGPGAHVHVGVSVGDRAVSFVVADDGVGFDPADVRDDGGLQLVRDRLLAADGTVEVRSAPGAGTTITGTIPIP